jgi:hypothetical protein
MNSAKGMQMNRSIKAGMVAVTLAAGVLVAPGSAEASSNGCSYPQVCLYAGSSMRRPVSRFRDVTSGWQWLGRSFGARSFRNTRHDDVAYLLTTTGRVICVRPGARGGLLSGGVTAIRISYRSTC